MASTYNIPTILEKVVKNILKETTIKDRVFMLAIIVGAYLHFVVELI